MKKVENMKHFLVMIFLVTLISCTYDDCITGNNNFIEKSSTPGNFENVVNSFPGKLVLKKGYSFVKYSIESNIENLLDVNVSSGTLKFSQYGEQCFDSHGIDFEVFSQNYKELKNNGSSDWTSDFLEFDPSIVSNGSGDIALVGKSENQSVLLSGSGNVDLTEMPTQNITVRNNSSGNVRAKARKNAFIVLNGSGNVEIDSLIGVLNAEINGSGNLIYSGNPSNIIIRNSGSGKLIKK